MVSLNLFWYLHGLLSCSLYRVNLVKMWNSPPWINTMLSSLQSHFTTTKVTGIWYSAMVKTLVDSNKSQHRTMNQIFIYYILTKAYSFSPSSSSPLPVTCHDVSPALCFLCYSAWGNGALEWWQEVKITCEHWICPSALLRLFKAGLFQLRNQDGREKTH